MKNSIRLQKYLSSCGIASRRKSEDLIINGKVKVNGIIINKLGAKVHENDFIELNNKQILPENKIYIALNKPENFLCTHQDFNNRKTIYDILKIKNTKLFSVGRLDYKSRGIILITNDGDFANRVIHPSNNVIKEYSVESLTAPSIELINSFKNGIKINDFLYKAFNIEKTENEKMLKIFLKEGKKREIREIYKYFKIKINTLQRNAIGGLRIEKLKLKVGEYKILSYNETNSLIFMK